MVQDDDGDLFGIEDPVVPSGTVVESERPVRVYHEAVVRPSSRLEAFASAGTEDDLFGGTDLWELQPLSELYPAQEEVRQLAGTNGLRSISLFTGSGGSKTGFAWAGWETLAAVEFVDAARDTLAANYPSYIVEPTDVLKVALEIIGRRGLQVLTTKSVPENFIGAIVIPECTVDGTRYPSTLDWEATLSCLGGLGAEFRTEVCRAVLEACKEESESKLFIWGDDVRGLCPVALLDFLGMERGELDCLEGSPPCKTFSTSGLRERAWGQKLHYSGERSQVADDLFLEYLRILTGLLPRSFVAENVAGLGMGEAELQVMTPLIQAFTELGYTVEARLMNSKDFSVPQSRPRIIFQGVRTDQMLPNGMLAIPTWPLPDAGVYTVQDALDAAAPHNTEEDLDWACIERFEIGKTWRMLPEGGAPENKAFQLIRTHRNLPSPTITQTSASNIPSAGPCHPFECRKFTVPEMRYLFSYPWDYVFTGSLSQQGERLGRSVTPLMMMRIASGLAGTLLAVDEAG